MRADKIIYLKHTGASVDAEAKPGGGAGRLGLRVSSAASVLLDDRLLGNCGRSGLYTGLFVS